MLQLSELNLTSDTKEQLDHTGIKDDGRPIFFAYVFWMASICDLKPHLGFRITNRSVIINTNGYRIGVLF